MKTIIKDDRTPEQRKSLNWAVVMRDKFLSGWGEACGGYSRCAWACKSLAEAERLESHIKTRSDAQFVAVIDLNSYRPSRSTRHFHIYVNKDGNS